MSIHNEKTYLLCITEDNGLTTCYIALFSPNYSGTLGNMYFIWKEEIQLNLF